MEASTGNQPGRENLKGAGNLPGHVDFFPFLLDFLWTVAFFYVFYVRLSLFLNLHVRLSFLF